MQQSLSAQSTDLSNAPVMAAENSHQHRLRLLSYNIQTGISSHNYRHYVTQSWKHVLPFPQRFENLDRIARLIQSYDVVGLQELDTGSLRSGFINLTQYLAERGRFPYWYDQTNRRVGKIARHATGMLSRVRPTNIQEHRLPGKIPGRGVLSVRYGTESNPLVLLIVHLALGRRARMQQLAYISTLTEQYEHVILMGDLNCHSQSEEMKFLVKNTPVRVPVHGLNTFPSWRPQRNIDHILVSDSLQVEHVKVLHYPFSDHLPVTMEVTIPESVQL